MPRPEFARDVRTRFSADCHAGRRGAAAGMHCGLRKRARCRVSGEPARRNLMFAGFGVARDYRALQRMTKAGTKTALRRSLVVQVLMKRGSHGMVNGGTYRVSREPRA